MYNLPVRTAAASTLNQCHKIVLAPQEHDPVGVIAMSPLGLVTLTVKTDNGWVCYLWLYDKKLLALGSNCAPYHAVSKGWYSFWLLFICMSLGNIFGCLHFFCICDSSESCILYLQDSAPVCTCFKHRNCPCVNIQLCGLCPGVSSSLSRGFKVFSSPVLSLPFLLVPVD